MAEVGHFIGGKHVAATGGRRQDIMQPMDGTVRGQVALGSKADLRKAVENAKAAQPAWARDQSAAARARADEVPRPGAARIRLAGRTSGARARQDHRRRQGRHPARPGSGRGLHRRAAYDEGRVHRRRRSRHRRLFDAPGARRGGRHHAVQLPGDDPAVEDGAGDRRRQRLHPEAVGARSGRADADCRTVHRGRPACRHPQRRQRRQGSGRRHPRRSRHQGDRLRRLLADRAVHLFARDGERQARAVFRRRQEPHDHHARRRHGPDRRRADRRRLRFGRRALHGDLGRRAGRQGHGRPADGAS